MTETKLQEKTVDFLKSLGLEPGNTGYITEKYTANIKSAVQAKEKKHPIGNGKDLYELVYNVTYEDDKIYFCESCGVQDTPTYFIYRRQLVSLQSYGSCYQFTVYKMTYTL
jgi:hypothetical protein